MNNSCLRWLLLFSLSASLRAIRHHDGDAQVLQTESGDFNHAQPAVYLINTRVWLYSLAQSGVEARCGMYVCLKDVPETEIQRLASDHIDIVWLMGIWQVGALGVQENKDSIETWRKELPDITRDDAIGSPYSISDYKVNSDIGTLEDLAKVRAALRKFGMRLMVDFVPNHSAKDAKWLETHPEIYLKRPQGDSSNNEWWGRINGVELAYGRSPFNDLWTDTLQLNYWSPKTIEVMTNLLVEVAKNVDGIRCDMAMLLLNDVFQRSWGKQMQGLGLNRPSQEFWGKAIGEVKRQFPETIFVAEAYDYGITQTPEKQILVQLGFDYVYDKDVLDNLERGLDNTRGYIQWRGGEYLHHTAHFVENHDEPRAAKAFGGGQAAFVGAIAATTLPGMRLFNDGQFDGLKNRLPVQLRRSASEPKDQHLHEEYTKYLGILSDPVFHKGTWMYIEVPKDNSGWRLMAWRWALGDSKRLVIVNFSDKSGGAAVHVADASGENGGDHIRLHELLTGVYYDRSANEMRGSGLYCILEPFTAQIFSY